MFSKRHNGIIPVKFRTTNTNSASYGPILHSYKRILQYLPTFYAQMLMHLISHICFYISAIDIKYLIDDGQDSSRLV